MPRRLLDLVQSNPLGTVKGYNPYDSGKLGKTREPPKKTDLRKLGDWLKLKKQAADNRRRGRGLDATVQDIAYRSLAAWPSR